jgi:hypothetical protein
MLDKLNRYILIVLTMWGLNSFKPVGATTIDSAEKSYLIREGASELNSLKERNEEYMCNGEYSKLNFVLILSPDTSGSYIRQSTLNGKESWLTQIPEINSLNSRLRQVYFKDTVECYLILINYFDIMMRAEVPGGLTVSDLFNTGKFFNENSNITTLKARHDSITNGIISQSIKNTSRSCIVLSFANYSGRIYGRTARKYALFTQKLVGGAPNSSSVFLYEINNVLSQRMHYCKDPRYKCGNNIGIVETVVEQIESAVEVTKYKSLIMSTYTTEGLAFILSRFNASGDYYSLSLPERLHILGVFANDQMVGAYNGNPGPEGWAIKVIKYTPQLDVVRLLRGLEKPSVLNSDQQYTGDKSNSDAMIFRLVGRIDDAVIWGVGDDNYKKLNQAIADKVLSSKEVRDSFSTTTPTNISERMIYWDETYTITTAPIGHNKYEITFDRDGSVRYKRSVIDHYEVGNMNVIPVFDDTYPEVRLKPFDIVVFVNNTNCSMIEDGGAGKGQLNFMPALFLKYANDKVFNESAMKIVATTTDVITLVTGPGLLFKAARAGKIAVALFEAANTVGAGANIVLNSSTVQDPTLRTLVDEFNTVVGTWGLTRLTSSGIIKLGGALDAALDESKMIFSISQDEARTYIQAYDDAKDKLGILLPGDKERLNKLMKLLEKGVTKIPLSSKITTLEQFLSFIPDKYRQRIINDFTDGKIIFKIATGNEIFYRRWGDLALEIGPWLSSTSYSKDDAKILLALPLKNNAENITQFKLSPGTPYIEGLASSKVGVEGFGSYALGQGNQIYILMEHLSNLTKIE